MVGLYGVMSRLPYDTQSDHTVICSSHRIDDNESPLKVHCLIFTDLYVFLTLQSFLFYVECERLKRFQGNTKSVFNNIFNCYLWLYNGRNYSGFIVASTPIGRPTSE